MHIHTSDTVLACGAFLRGAAKRIEVLGHSNGREPDGLQDDCELCLRQSAGDSTRPEIDVAPNRLGEFAGDEDVPVEELTARFENPEYFTERP